MESYIPDELREENYKLAQLYIESEDKSTHRPPLSDSFMQKRIVQNVCVSEESSKTSRV